MGQNKLTILFEWQVGFLINYDEDFLTIQFPFISVMLGLNKYSQGVEIFGKYFTF